MAGGAFDPAEFAAFKGVSPAPAAPAPGGFDPAEFEAFKGPAPEPERNEAERATAALKPFFDKGISTRNSAGQWTGEARALLSKEGLNPDLIDHKAEKSLLAGHMGASQPAGDESAAVGRGIINGIPVAGPAILGGTNKAIAFVRSVQNGTSYTDELKNVEAFGEKTTKANPGSTLGGEIAGGVLGTAPLVAAAPAAFGAGTAGLAVRSGASLASGTALGGADAAVRNDGDVGETAKGALIGGVLGGAAPAIGAGVGRVVGAMRGGPKAPNLLREGLEGFTPEELSSAQALIRETGELPGGGARLTLGEALNKVTDGRAGRLSQLERVVANSGGEAGQMAGKFYSARPGEIERVGRAAFDAVAPENLAPTRLGSDVQAAARSGVASTPEGMALTQARDAVGPRVTPDEAGQVIQREAVAVRDARETARRTQADRDYAAAREAPENVGVERTIAVERPGEPIVTQPQYSRPQFDERAPAPLSKPDFSAEAADGPGESLARFIKRNGGIELNGDVRAAGLGEMPIPGVGYVAKEGGKSIDGFWRTALKEAGYLQRDADGYTTTDITNLLIRKLQNEQRGVPSYANNAERSAGRTRGSQADEYANNLSQWESRLDDDLVRAGVSPDSLHPDIRERALGSLMRGETSEPLDAYERVIGGMKGPLEPYVKSTTVREEIPDVVFGQVNPTPAAEAVAGQARTAKGDVRGALASVERDLRGPNGQPDMSVEGLLKARERLDFQIQQAREVGDATKGRDLQIPRSALDRSLKSVPEVATADANFAANSVPLAPFAGDAPLGRITQQNATSGRLAVPSEQVPSHLQGASASREFLANATPEARLAYEGHLATRILDGVTDRAGSINADALGMALRDNADLLRQTPAVAQRLQGVINARDALGPVNASPLGRVAASPEIDSAVRTLFSPNPGAGTHVEVSSAMRAIAQADPRAALQVSRYALESVFNEATQQTKGMASQYGGAGFASAVRGNSQQAKNLEAMFRALPQGDVRWAALDRMMTALEATGYRPQKGSDTAFNQAIQKQLTKGAPVSQAINDAVAGGAAGAVASGPKGAAAGAYFGLKRNVGAALDDRQVRKNAEAIAQIVFDPRSTLDLHALARAPVGSQRAAKITQRLLGSLSAPANANQERVREAR